MPVSPFGSPQQINGESLGQNQEQKPPESKTPSFSPESFVSPAPSKLVEIIWNEPEKPQSTAAPTPPIQPPVPVPPAASPASPEPPKTVSPASPLSAPSGPTFVFEPTAAGLETAGGQTAAPEQPRDTTVREITSEVSHADDLRNAASGIQSPQEETARNYKPIYLIVGITGLVILLGTGFYFFVWPRLQNQMEEQTIRRVELPPAPQEAPAAAPTSAPKPQPAPETPEPQEAPAAAPTLSGPTPAPPAPIPTATSASPPPPIISPSPQPTVEEGKALTITFNRSRDAWGWVIDKTVYLRWNPKDYSLFNVAERVGTATTWNTVVTKSALPEHTRTVPLAAKRIDFRIQAVDAAGKILETYLIISFSL